MRNFGAHSTAVSFLITKQLDTFGSLVHFSNSSSPFSVVDFRHNERLSMTDVFTGLDAFYSERADPIEVARCNELSI